MTKQAGTGGGTAWNVAIWILPAGLILAVLVAWLLSLAEPEPEVLTAELVWPVVADAAAERGLDPHFLFAIAWAESSLRPRAANGSARGLMQLSPAAWEQIRGDTPFDEAWNWRENVAAGADYLAWCRGVLERREVFNYPRLAACYRFGPGSLARADYDLGQLPQPRNAVYQALFADEEPPVPWVVEP